MANLPIYSFSAHLYSSHVSFKIDFSHPPPPPLVLLPACLPALHYTGVKKKNPEWKMFKAPGVMWSVGWSRQEFLVNLEILFVLFVHFVLTEPESGYVARCAQHPTDIDRHIFVSVVTGGKRQYARVMVSQLRDSPPHHQSSIDVSERIRGA
jgi:hypothetical protein